MNVLSPLDGILARVEQIEAMAATLASTFPTLLEGAERALARPTEPAPTLDGDALLPDTRPYGVSTSGPPLPDGLTPELVAWRGVILNPAAMASFQAASRILGAPIAVTDSYRTHAQQAAAYARKPGLAAPPGTSYHERGLAIDVDGDAYGGYGSPRFRRVVAVLESLGWHRFDPQSEPWHFSYMVTG